MFIRFTDNAILRRTVPVGDLVDAKAGPVSSGEIDALIGAAVVSRALTTMLDQSPITPGIRILCRDGEWLVTRVEVSDDANQEFAVHCVGGDDLVRGHQAVFLTQLDRIEVVDPHQTCLVADASSGYRLSKLFLEAQLRQMPATGINPDLTGMEEFQKRYEEGSHMANYPKFVYSDRTYTTSSNRQRMKNSPCSWD